MPGSLVDGDLETADVEARAFGERGVARAGAKDVIGWGEARGLGEGQVDRLFISRFEGTRAERGAMDFEPQTVAKVRSAAVVVRVVMREEQFGDPVECEAIGRDVPQNLVG